MLPFCRDTNRFAQVLSFTVYVPSRYFAWLANEAVEKVPANQNWGYTQMVSRPEIVAYKSNAAVVFLVNLSIYLFLQPQRLALAASPPKLRKILTSVIVRSTLVVRRGLGYQSPER